MHPRIVADQEQALRVAATLARDRDHPLGCGEVEPLVVQDRRLRAQRRGGQLPGVHGPPRGRAQHEVGHEVLLAQQVAHAARRLQAARSEIALVVGHARLVPARLGVAEEKQLEHLDVEAPGMG